MDNYLNHILQKKPDLVFPDLLPDSPELKAELADVSNEEYHAIKNMASASLVKEMLESPRDYLHALYENQIGESKEEDHFRFGRLFHEAILEPKKFQGKKIHVKDFGHQGKKENKLAKKEFMESINPGDVVFKPKEHEAFLGMLHSLLDHNIGRNLFREGIPEGTVLFRDTTKIACRARWDYYIPKKKWLVEIKTTRATSPALFKADISKLHYDFQMGFQAMGHKMIYGSPPEMRVIVAISKVPPHHIWIFMLDDNFVESGDAKYRWSMDMLAKCLRLKQFPAKQINAEMVSPPSWAQYESFPQIEFKEQV